MCLVTIPALTTIVDRQFKEDRTLCPVWALGYCLDKTKDLRGSRSPPFISFEKGRTSDIRPTTLSSWLKQTILLCYKHADKQALDLSKLKCMTLGPLRPFWLLRWGTGGPNHSSLSLQVNQIFKPRFCVHCEALGAILHISELGCTFPFNLNIQAVSALSFIQYSGLWLLTGPVPRTSAL